MIEVLNLIAERGGNPELVREGLRNRNMDEQVVDRVIDLWQDAYRTRYEVSRLRTCLNQVQKEIKSLKKTDQDLTSQLATKTILGKEIEQVEELAVKRELLRDKMCKAIPNYLHPSVPVGNDEVRAPIFLLQREFVGDTDECRNDTGLQPSCGRVGAKRLLLREEGLP